MSRGKSGLMRMEHRPLSAKNLELTERIVALAHNREEKEMYMTRWVYDLSRMVALASVLLLTMAMASRAVAQSTIQPGILLTLTPFASGLGGEEHGSPLDAVPIPGDPERRMAIATFRGLVRLVDSSGQFLDTVEAPFLHTNTQWIPDLFGLTGIAFHPDYLNPGMRGFGKFYAIVSDAISSRVDFPGVGDDGFGAHDEILREYTADDPGSKTPIFTSRDVIRFHQRTGFHNITDLAFDSQGLLYLAAGESQNSSAAQSKEDFLGTIFRIDPLDPSAFTNAELLDMERLRSFNENYANPITNPGIGAPAVLNEVFAFGLRSPFRLSTDRGAADGTGRDDVYVADVGSDLREEVNKIVNNGNYGWDFREGTLGPQPAGGSIDPIFELENSTALNPYDLISGAVTIIGGFVYRGNLLPELQGKYVFGEMGRAISAAQQGNKPRLFYGDLDTGEVFQLFFDPAGANFDGKVLLSIGEDEAGELYAVLGEDPGVALAGNPDGVVLRLDPPL